MRVSNDILKGNTILCQFFGSDEWNFMVVMAFERSPALGLARISVVEACSSSKKRPLILLSAEASILILSVGTFDVTFHVSQYTHDNLTHEFILCFPRTVLVLGNG